ncbi:MAG: co-chaperone DjlA [Neisseriaceae bacterium]
MNSINLLRQLVAQSVPAFFITLLLTAGNLKLALLFTLISIGVNFFRIRNLTKPLKIYSQFFSGQLTALDYHVRVTFYVLGAMAKAKGRVTESDIEYAESLMREFQIHTSSRPLIIEAFTLGKANAYQLEGLIAEFCHWFKKRGNVLNYFFEYQLNAALQDGELHPGELSILRTIAYQMGMNDLIFTLKLQAAQAAYRTRRGFGYKQAEETRREWDFRSEKEGQGDYSRASWGENITDKLRNAYAILGVKESDEFSTVRKAYRKLIKQYHPDRYASKEVPTAVLEKAKQKSQEIIAAYHFICKAKGWK